jgi:hypothetical protein
MTTPRGVATAVTSAAGEFEFPGVVPGRYQLSAVLFPMREPNGSLMPGDAWWVLQSVDVGDADISGLPVVLQRGIEVSGRVVFEGATGVGVGEHDRLLVTLLPIGAGTMMGARTELRPDGTFRSTGLPPGRYRIDSSISCRPGECSSDWKVLTVTHRGRPLPYETAVVESTEVAGLEVTFSERETRLSGSVTDDTATTGPTTIDVVAFPADSTLWQRDGLSPRFVRSVPASPTGDYEIQGLAPGEYRVAAFESWYPIDGPAALERLIPGAVTVTLRAGDPISVGLTLFRPSAR